MGRLNEDNRTLSLPTPPRGLRFDDPKPGDAVCALVLAEAQDEDFYGLIQVSILGRVKAVEGDLYTIDVAESTCHEAIEPGRIVKRRADILKAVVVDRPDVP